MRKSINVDLEILFHLAALAEKYIEELEIYRPTKIVEEFAVTLEKEINFNIEASYVERFARQFLGNETIYVPKIFRQLTTEHVLTMEYVEGIKVSDITALDQRGFDRKIIAFRGADLMLEQIFMNGFFHAGANCIFKIMVVARHNAMAASIWLAMPNSGQSELMPPSGSRTP